MVWSRLLPVLACSLAAQAADPPADKPTVNITIDGAQRYQEVDGFGVSEAFQRAYVVFGSQGLSPANQSKVLDLLFSLEKGAGFTILRNGIGSSNNSMYSRMTSFEPKAPSSPDAEPEYHWDHDNSGQFRLAQEAYSRGIQHLYGSSWSAPSFMKTSGADEGGNLCGVTGAPACPTGNWIKAYAKFLLKYVQFYKESDMKVTELGFLNEPEITTNYISMESNGEQSADIIREIGAQIKAAGLDVKLTCCDGLGWKDQQNKMAALQAGPDPAENYLSIITGHGYSSIPNFPLTTKLKTWQTEMADLTGRYTPNVFYEDGSPGEGLSWAYYIQEAFVGANVSAFLYWIGAETTKVNTGLINLEGDKVIVTKRYWTFAHFSKFVRPGARRIDAESSDDPVRVSSFLNTDGVVATQLANYDTTATYAHIEFRNLEAGDNSLQVYYTDNDNDFAPLVPTPSSDGGFNVVLPPASLLSFVWGAKPPSEAKLLGEKKTKHHHHKEKKTKHHHHKEKEPKKEKEPRKRSIQIQKLSMTKRPVNQSKP